MERIILISILVVSIGLAWFWEPAAIHGLWRIGVRLAFVAVGLAFVLKAAVDFFSALRGTLEDSGLGNANSTSERIAAIVLSIPLAAMGIGIAWAGLFYQP